MIDCQIVNDRKIIGECLSKPDTRINQYLISRHSGGLNLGNALLKPVEHIIDNIIINAVFMRVSALAWGMHENDGSIAIAGNL